MSDVLSQDPRILAQRFDPKMLILGLFVLKDFMLIRTHKDQFGQNVTVSVRIPDVTYLPTVVHAWAILLP
jgi:hypothetical protein